jgi:hypothetical protein
MRSPFWKKKQIDATTQITICLLTTGYRRSRLGSHQIAEDQCHAGFQEVTTKQKNLNQYFTFKFT